MCRANYLSADSDGSARVNRRTFLGSVGTVGSLAVIGYAGRSDPETLSVRFWRSERAARYSSISDRIRELLSIALDLPYWSLEVSDGGVVEITTEDGARVTSGGEWPTTVVSDWMRIGGVEPASDVNLLVTDGRLGGGPSGYGMPHVASVGGARHLSEFSISGGRSASSDTVRPVTRPNFVAHVLVHEVGHALGLGHAHGEIDRRNGSVVVTPMLSAYAWDTSYARRRSSCGGDQRITDGSDVEWLFQYEYSGCAQRRLERYRGSHVP